MQPALVSGYRFEDERLVEDMLRDVAQERGALPLLAFALARLWEHRDRERGLLTRRGYGDIGGVAGALAQHAEATLDTIGAARVPIVREILRNLVTAEGTRALQETIVGINGSMVNGTSVIRPSPGGFAGFAPPTPRRCHWGARQGARTITEAASPRAWHRV